MQLAESEACAPDLETLIRNTGLELAAARDGWGTRLRYHCQAPEIVEISSAGPDREFGSRDDVVLAY